MKGKLTKLSELQLTLLFTGIVEIIIFSLCCIGFAFNQPGWAIGAAFGTVAAFLSTLLVNLSSTYTLKGEKTGAFLLGYFTRMILFVGMFAMLVVFQYKLEYEVFTNSFWGMAIAFLPSTIVTIFVQLVLNKEK